MSSDPKKPGFDAPPPGTPDLLQQDLSLDRRRRVPSFEELQARPVPTDPMRPAMQRPIPSATVPARPSNLDEATTQQRPVPPGLQQRQPVVPIRTATPPTQPQVTPSVPSHGGLRPDGQPALRVSQQGLKPAPPPPRVVHDEPEPRPLQAASSLPRSFTPPPAPPRNPNALPAELLVTQPGLPGPFAARELPHHQAVPQRPPSLPELPRAHAPDSNLHPALGDAPQFEQAHFEERTVSADTVIAEPAALWRRLGAWLTDLIFVGVLVLGLLMVAMTLIAPKNLTPLQQLMAIALPAAGLAGVLAFVYTTLFAFLWAGRTPGRRLMGIRLVDVTGHAPGVARSLLRAALCLVSFALCLSGFWLALFDRHGQTLHDKLTRTFVVKLQDA